jgi:hypothetical protein
MSFLSLLLIGFSAFADIGFYPELPDHPEVQAQANKVYKGYFPAGQMVKIDKAQLPNLDLSVFAQDPNVDEATYAAELLVKRQIEVCLQTPDEDCYLMNNSVRGSLFFVENEATLYTAFHNIQDFVLARTHVEMNLLGIHSVIGQELALQSMITKDVSEVDPFDVSGLIEQYQFIQKKAQVMVIINSDGEVVFGENPGEFSLQVDFMPEILFGVFGVDRIKGSTDFARVVLNKEVGEVIPVDESPEMGDDVFLIGYPSASDRSSFEKGSSSGERLYFSMGQLLTLEEVQQRSGVTFQDPSASQEQSDLITFCSCDGAPGNSGGVGVNEKGEATFVTVHFLPNDGRPINEDNIMMFGARVSHMQSFFAELEVRLASSL